MTAASSLQLGSLPACLLTAHDEPVIPAGEHLMISPEGKQAKAPALTSGLDTM